MNLARNENPGDTCVFELWASTRSIMCSGTAAVGAVTIWDCVDSRLRTCRDQQIHDLGPWTMNSVFANSRNLYTDNI